MLYRNFRWWAFPCLAVLWVVLALGRELLFESALLVSSGSITAEVSTKLQHDTCKYLFTLDGQTYDGRGFDCGHYEVGAPMTVYYWPVAPEISSNRQPGSTWLTNIAVAVGALLVGCLLGFINRRDDNAPAK